MERAKGEDRPDLWPVDERALIIELMLYLMVRWGLDGK